MNCGLGNLDGLRRHLLPGPMLSDRTFDPQITDIGLGVAAAMDVYCNRSLGYAEHVTQEFRGNRSHWYMPRFPFTSIEDVQLRFFQADNWTDISGQPLAVNEETGLLSFGYTLGVDPIQVKVTWTGGYWFETLEPDDAGYPSSLPALVANCTTLSPSKFLLPADIRLAWLTQCREVWSQYDKLGQGLVDKPGQQSGTASLDLSPMVRTMLRGYVRMQIS